MRNSANGFKTLYFNDLKRAFVPTIVLALFAVAFDVFCAKTTSIGLYDEDYCSYWIWRVPYFTCLSCAILPAYAFIAERQEGGFDVLKRLPVSTATVYWAKLSAILTLIAATCVFFVVSSFAIDVYYDDSASTTLLAQFKGDDVKASRLRIRFLAYMFSAFELFCWSAFWATRTRRLIVAFFASVAAALATNFLVGFVVVLVVAALGGVAWSLETFARCPVFLGLFWLNAYGSSATVALGGFGALRLAVLIIPLYGIYRQCRRDGASTAFILNS